MADFSSRYQYASSSMTSLTAGTTYEDPRFHLHLVHKKDAPSERPMIMSTKSERLAFYRAYTSTSSKTEIMATQSVNVNSFLWHYILDTLFKTLPHSFVHFFMAAYAPEEHMFVTKMVPFCIGLKYLFIIVGFVEMISNVDLSITLLHYSIAGLLAKNPWNRCPNPSVYYDKGLNATVRCFELEEFAKMFENRTYDYLDFTFIYKKHYHFQVSQIEYYRQKIIDRQTKNAKEISMFLILWATITFYHLQVKQKHFWKLTKWSQWAINIVDILNMLYFALVHSEDAEVYKKSKVEEDDNVSSYVYADIELLAESITAPSLIHILTSRSTQEIDPATDSAVMVISNALIFIFRGLLNSSVQAFCEMKCRTEIPITQFNEHAWFYFWPMFWSSFYLGDIFSISYFILNLVNECLIITVIYACVMESLIYEWPIVKRWMAMLTFGVAGILLHVFTTVDERIVLWIYGKGIATLSETIFIYVMYPVGRLVDDFMFHYGVPPTKLRVLNLRLVPVFYAFKLYVLFKYVWCEMERTGYVSHYYWSWVLVLLPILLGNMFIVYKYLVVYRMTWKYIFRPLSKWGPRDFSVRQLRKQFDSRYYIGHEVPRLLSRYLISKRDSKVYKVDVRYDFARRSTVTGARYAGVRFGGEDKSKNE